MPLASKPGATRPKNFIGDPFTGNVDKQSRRRCLGILNLEKLCKMRDESEITQEEFDKLTSIWAKANSV